MKKLFGIFAIISLLLTIPCFAQKVSEFPKIDESKLVEEVSVDQCSKDLVIFQLFDYGNNVFYGKLSTVDFVFVVAKFENSELTELYILQPNKVVELFTGEALKTAPRGCKALDAINQAKKDFEKSKI